MSVLYSKYIKRLFDFVISLLVIVLLSPLLLVLFILIHFKLGRPVLFKQVRIGKDEKKFTMYKFRTMTDDTDINGVLLLDEKRLTKFGGFIRSSGLDELPELFNILVGDMSIVGPRPLVPEYLPYYSREERVRHTVRGGLTQPEVLYGNSLPTWDDQLQYEVEYTKNVTFLTDIKIIIMTFRTLFNRVESDYGTHIRKSLSEERDLK